MAKLARSEEMIVRTITTACSVAPRRGNRLAQFPPEGRRRASQQVSDRFGNVGYQHFHSLHVLSGITGTDSHTAIAGNRHYVSKSRVQGVLQGRSVRLRRARWVRGGCVVTAGREEAILLFQTILEAGPVQVFAAVSLLVPLFIQPLLVLLCSDHWILGGERNNEEEVKRLTKAQST